MLTYLLEGIAWRLGKTVVEKAQLGRAVGDEFLARLFKEFQVSAVVDIGANEGQYAKRLRDKSHYNGAIHSYEPIPEVYQQLLRAAATDDQWSVFPYAVDSKGGRRLFNVMVGSEFSSFLHPTKEHAGAFDGQHVVAKTVEVEIIGLDDVLHKFTGRSVDWRALLKLDTQGTELRILESVGDAVRQFAAIQVEVAFEPIYEGAPTITDISAWMKSKGFALSSLFANNEGHFPRLLEMDAVFTRSDLVDKFSL